MDNGKCKVEKDVLDRFMKNTLVAVGALKTPWAKEGCRQYMGRLHIDVIEVSASKQKDPAKQKEEESTAILSRLEKMHGQVWVLDETGQAMTSPDFSSALERLADRGDSVIFVLGGAYGMSDAVVQKAHTVLRLSDMVLPHELCRVVFLEQLYRAEQIQKGTGYHHA